jgi:opacity protein-like surface antigen
MKYSKCLLAIIFSSCLTMPVLAAEHSLGFGGHYFRTMDEISDDLEDDYADAFHKDGIGFNISYRYKPSSMFGMQLELQVFPDGYYFAKNAYSPRILFVIGSTLYLGAGVAWNYLTMEDSFNDIVEDGEWTDSYYLIRAGVELPIFAPQLKFDLNANYELNEWSELDEYNSDYLSFGIGLRILL